MDLLRRPTLLGLDFAIFDVPDAMGTRAPDLVSGYLKVLADAEKNPSDADAITLPDF